MSRRRSTKKRTARKRNTCPRCVGSCATSKLHQKRTKRRGSAACWHFVVPLAKKGKTVSRVPNITALSGTPAHRTFDCTRPNLYSSEWPRLTVSLTAGNNTNPPGRSHLPEQPDPRKQLLSGWRRHYLLPPVKTSYRERFIDVVLSRSVLKDICTRSQRAPRLTPTNSSAILVHGVPPLSSFRRNLAGGARESRLFASAVSVGQGMT